MSEILSIVKTPLSSLLSALVLYFFYLQVKKHASISNWIKLNLSTVVVILLLIVVGVPFMLYFSNLLPHYIVNAFVREIIISIIIILPLTTLWLVLRNLVRNLLLINQQKRLSFIEQLDLRGETWIALEQDLISEEEAEKAKILRSLRKWIVQGNEIGWYEIVEQVVHKLTDIQARWFVFKRIEFSPKEKNESGILGHDHIYEKRLEALIPEELVDTVLREFDEDLVSEDIAYEALELIAFKKWAWKNDETGWVDLQYIRAGETLSPKLIKFAEFELWEINKKKGKNEKIDIVREKKLKELVFA